MNKIYDTKFKCSFCKRIIGESNLKNRSRVIKSWRTICGKCVKKLIDVKGRVAE